MSIKVNKQLKEVFKETRDLEERAQNLRKEAVRLEIRKKLIRKDSYVIDLKDQSIGEVFLVDEWQGFFKAIMLDTEEVRTYKYTDYNVRIAAEEELIEYFANNLLIEGDTSAKFWNDQKYVYLSRLSKVARILHAEKNKIEVEFLFKLKEQELIKEDTDMSAYFLRKQVLDTKNLEWRKADQSEIDLFLKKVDEMQSA